MKASPSEGFVRLDRDYILLVRPYLSERECRVYEAIVLECDGWNRPTSASAIAEITHLHIDHVRKAIRSLEAIELIQGLWIGNPRSHYAKRSFGIVRVYEHIVSCLATLGRIGPQTLGRNSPQTPGQISPQTVGRIGPGHLIARSDPDPSRSLPSPPAIARDLGSPPQGTKERIEPSVPEELVELSRKLWSTEVAKKAARRYLMPLLATGTPVASADEVARYLRAAAKSPRIERAKFPLAAACVVEEFADWLHRARRVRLLPVAPKPDCAAPAAMTANELSRRAAEFARSLGAAGRDPTTKSSVRPVERPASDEPNDPPTEENAHACCYSQS